MLQLNSPTQPSETVFLTYLYRSPWQTRRHPPSSFTAFYRPPWPAATLFFILYLDLAFFMPTPLLLSAGVAWHTPAPPLPPVACQGSGRCALIPALPPNMIFVFAAANKSPAGCYGTVGVFDGGVQ